MSSRNSFLDNIDLPSSQRRKVERVRRRSGSRGSGRSGDAIRQETQAEKEQRERQQALTSLQSELREKNILLTESDAQAILEGKSVSEVRSQVAVRSRQEALKDLQKDLSVTGAVLSEREAQAIIEGRSVQEVRDAALTRSQQLQARKARESAALEAAKVQAVQQVRSLQIADRLFSKQEEIAAREEAIGARVAEIGEARRLQSEGMLPPGARVIEAAEPALIRRQTQKREAFIDFFKSEGAGDMTARLFADSALGRERLVDGAPGSRVLSSKSKPEDFVRAAKEIPVSLTASTSADLFTLAGVVASPRFSVAAAGGLARELRADPKRTLAKILKDSSQNPLTATIDVLFVASAARKGGELVVQGARKVDDFVPKTRAEAQFRADAAIKLTQARAQGAKQAFAEVLDDLLPLADKRGQVKNPGKRTLSKAEIRKQSLNQAFNPNVAIQQGKIIEKTGRSRASRKSIELLDDSGVRVVSDRRGARTGLGRAQEKTVVTVRKGSVDVDVTLGVRKGQDATLGGKAFSRPSSQVSSPKAPGLDPVLVKTGVGNQLLVGKQFQILKEQKNIPFSKRVPRKKQTPTFDNPADFTSPTTVLKPQKTSGQAPVTKRGTRPQSKREARFQARKERLAKQRKEQFVPNVFNEPSAVLPLGAAQVGGLVDDAAKLSVFQAFDRSLESIRSSTSSQLTPSLSQLAPTRVSKVVDTSVKLETPQVFAAPSKVSLDSKRELDVAVASTQATSILPAQEIVPATSFSVDQRTPTDTAFGTSFRRITRKKEDAVITPNPGVPKPPSISEPVRPRKTPEPRRPDVGLPRVPPPTVPRPPPPRIKTPPTAPPIKLSKQKPRENLFRVVVGKADNVVFKDFGVGGFETIRRAKEFVRETAAASIKITPVSRAMKLRAKDLGDDFVASKTSPFRFVEKKEKRISTAGELQQITMQGLLAQKRSRVASSFSLGIKEGALRL